jgi:hypothetical protein
MRKLTFLCTAAILASAAILPPVAQAASCALYDPTCATYPIPSNDTSARAEANRADIGTYQRRHQDRVAYRADRAAQREVINGREPSGFWPADVAGAAVGTAAGVAVGAVDTAGAIATAPFRPADSYAYYNNGYNGWDRQSYAERNGFVCTPGTYFKGPDGFRHLCQ